jgi:hypothetical protein
MIQIGKEAQKAITRNLCISSLGSRRLLTALATASAFVTFSVHLE